MIRIYIDRLPEIQQWYAEQMVPLIASKPLRPSGQITSTPRIKDFYHNLELISNDVIRDILLNPIDILCKQYTWILEYVMLCDVTARYSSFRKNHPGHGMADTRVTYITQYLNCGFWEDALREEHMSPEIAGKSWKKLEKVINKAKQKLSIMNDLVGQKFNYCFLTEEIRGMLVEQMDIPICPYCNRQYIQPITIDEKKRYLGDLDHILPKSLYCLFSLSLWNLTPSCKICNQIFKKDKSAKILNPQEQGFDADCILILQYNNVRQMIGMEPPAGMQWEIQPSASEDIKAKLENNLRVFHLNEVYKYHQLDMQRILQCRYQIECTSYYRDLVRILPMSDDPWLWYGVSLEPSKFQNELLSKAIYDIIFYN